MTTMTTVTDDRPKVDDMVAVVGALMGLDGGARRQLRFSAITGVAVGRVPEFEAHMHARAMHRIHPPFQMPKEKAPKPRPGRVTPRGTR